ncbi:MAG: glycosyltransferase [Proteobacteria bacterium]|nr:glycosyltransferase [Pseudomonadota bacterium]
MNSFKPWRILHLDLNQGIPELSVISGIQGIYVIFWWHHIPLGEMKILNADLPLNASQVTQLAIKSIAPAVGSYLIKGRSKAPHKGIPGNQSHAGLADLSSLMEITLPLKRLKEKYVMEEPPDIPTSVVICTRDRPEFLKRCLRSLSSLTRKPMEILVVDNTPTSDETHCIVRSMTGVQYILEPRPGLDIARNTGVLYSSGNIVAFLDDDVTVHPHWLEALHRAFQTPEVMAVTGLVLPAKLETEAQYIFETHWSFNQGYSAKIFDTNYFRETWHQGTPVWKIGAGANMAFIREAFALVGPFDDRLDVGAAGCSGDSEFWYRVLAENYSCLYEPTAVVYHYHRRDYGSFKRQIFYYLRGHVSALLIQFEKYKHWGNLRRLLLSLPRYYMRLICNGMIRRSGTRRSTVVHEIAGCLSGVKFYLLNMRGRKKLYKTSLVSYRRGVQPDIGNQKCEDRGKLDIPLVSVIIPCFNQAEFLGEAIQNVMQQTYRNFEIIVVDDGSSDNTREVASGFSAVRYIRHHNRGLAGARNTGIWASKGCYLVFLDADDRLLPQALESGLDCFRSHRECAFVFGQHWYLKSDGTSFEEMQTLPSDHNLFLARLREDKDHYRSLLYGNYIGMHASVMYRRDIFQYFKGFDPSLNAAEDYELYLRITRNYPVYFHNAVVAEYRWHSTNMTKNAELMLRSVMTVLRSQRKYVKDDKNYMEAYRAGINFWIEYYGYDLIQLVKTQLSMGGKRIRALRGIVTLIIYAPRWSSLYAIKYVKRCVKRTLKSLCSISTPAFLKKNDELSQDTPPPGHVQFGDLRRLTPAGDKSSGRQGNAIYYYYTERFLGNNANRIQGLVLEAGGYRYAERYGRNSVSKVDVLLLKGPSVPGGKNIVTLDDADRILSHTYDCIILPQTLQYTYDIKAALITLYRILKHGGVLLATVPGISRNIKENHDANRFWSFTALSAYKLCEEVFPASHISVSSYGNVMTATALMHGLTAEELNPGQLDFNDPLYQVVVTIRAVKP